MCEITAILVGALIGSFLNVVIYRLPLKQSLIFPPSHCPQCQHRLGILDLVPVLSYVFLWGQCRYCNSRISPRYPIVEALTALAFLLVYQQFGLTLNTLVGWLLTSVLVVCAYIDVDHGIIPDRVTYPALLAGLILSWWTIGLKSSLLGAAFFAGILLLAAIISRGGMGIGDVKLAAAIGAYTGLTDAMASLFIASVVGGLWALLLLITRQAGRKTAIRFGPFLALGGWLGLIYGSWLINWYLNLLVR